MRHRLLKVVILIFLVVTTQGCSDAADRLSYALTDTIVSNLQDMVEQSGYQERFSEIQKDNVLTYYNNGLFKVKNIKTKLCGVVDINCNYIPNIPKENNDIHILPNGLISVVDEENKLSLYDSYGNKVEISYTNIYSSTDSLNEESPIYITTIDSLSKYIARSEKIKTEQYSQKVYKTHLDKLWSTPEANKLAILPENKVEVFGDKLIAYDDNSVKILRDDNGKVFYLPLTDIQFKVTQNGLLVYKYKNYLTLGNDSIDLKSEDYQIITALNRGVIIEDREEYYLIKLGDTNGLEAEKLPKNIIRLKNIVISHEENKIIILNQNGSQRVLEDTNLKVALELKDGTAVIQTDTEIYWVDKLGNIKSTIHTNENEKEVRLTLDREHIILEGKCFDSGANEAYKVKNGTKLENIFISKKSIALVYGDRLDIVDIPTGEILTSQKIINITGIEKFKDYFIIQQESSGPNFLVLSIKGI